MAFATAELENWLAANVDDYAGPLNIAQFVGGQSNPTYRLDTPDRRYVLRRKPPGVLLPGAHDVAREARIIAALWQGGFPVPRVFGSCDDDTVIGTAFYVMEMVEGRIFWDARLPDLDADQRAACYDAMNATLATLHGLDDAALGLGELRRDGSYVARQIRRWSKQYLDDPAAGRDPQMDRLVDWLPAHLPVESPSCIVHGDYRIDNLIFHPSEPRVLAVLDWELATIGDPLADFAYHAMMYRTPPYIVAGLAGTDPASLGLPGEADYVAAYCRRTGRTDFPDFDFYLAYNLFRLAAICHGIRGRVIRGTASSAEARQRGEAVGELARLAWNIVKLRV